MIGPYEFDPLAHAQDGTLFIDLPQVVAALHEGEEIGA